MHNAYAALYRGVEYFHRLHVTVRTGGKKNTMKLQIFLLLFELFKHWSGNNEIMIYYIHRPKKREKLKAVYANFKLSFGFSFFFNSHCGQYEQSTKERR